MNISGSSVLAALRKSVKSPQSMIVIHDSLSHRPETISYKFGGSANGHNGVKSVISSLRTTDFHRLRMGIGRDVSTDPAEYVLSKLSHDERAYWGSEGEGMDVVLKEIVRVARAPPR
jgi:PTH1 family peptidyl-tRNA hydrolase